MRGRRAVEGGDKGRERDITGTRGQSAISGARTVRSGGRGQGAGARYRVRGRCVVEGGDKGRERDIGCAVEGGSAISGARWTRGESATLGAPSVEGGDKGRERNIGCADGARWRAGTTGTIEGARWRAGIRGGSTISGARWRAGIRGGSTISGARWRAGTRGGSAISGARWTSGESATLGAPSGWRAGTRGGSAVEGGDQGAGARWRAGIGGGSAISGVWMVRGGDKGREREGDDGNRCRNSAFLLVVYARFVLIYLRNYFCFGIVISNLFDG